MSYPAYAEMKASGVEWLGDVPQGWQTVASKYLYSIQLGKMLQNVAQSKSDVQVAYLKSVNVQWESVNVDDPDTKMWASIAELSQYNIQEGDLLVCEGGEVGRAGIVPKLPEKFIIQNALHRVRSNSNDLRYLMYLLEAAAAANWFEVLCSRATIAHFTGEKFGALRFARPSLPEQQQIAAFLDRKTAELDAVLRLKERQLELLTEKRQALISQAVTRGLDPTAPLKPSGIPWLGDVPEHWEVKRLKFLTYFVTSGSRGWAEYYSDDGAMFIRIGNLTRHSIDLDFRDLQHVKPPRGAEGERTRVMPNDVLVSVTAFIGSIAVVPRNLDEAYVNQHIALARPRTNVIPKWLGYCLLSGVGQRQLEALSNGGTKEGLGLEDVSNLTILYPPLAEQQAIVAYLDRETARMDGTARAIRAQIGKVREYRQALISAAVTGKIDVRERAGIPS